MNLPPDEALTRFASRLGCHYSCERDISVAPLASTLPHFLASNDAHAERICTFPSLSVKSSRRERTVRNNLSERVRDDSAARLLRRPTRLSQRSLALAPSIILRHMLCSFGHILEECLQDSVLSLVQECSEAQLKSGKGKVPAALAVLSSSSRKASPITPLEVATDFFTLESGDFKSLDSNYDEVATPLKFHAHFFVTVLGKKEVVVKVKAPGSISGIFKRNRAESIDVAVDTKVLIKSMKKACEKIVKETMAIATGQNDKQKAPRSVVSLKHDAPERRIIRAVEDTRQDEGDHETMHVDRAKEKISPTDASPKMKRCSSSPNFRNEQVDWSHLRGVPSADE